LRQGHNQGQEDHKSFFRKGVNGKWSPFHSPLTQRILQTASCEFLIKTGYEHDYSMVEQEKRRKMGKNMQHILHVVGARPNFMKAAPVIDALNKQEGITQTLVHTGQHYDANMSAIFFDELGLPKPDINLEVGSASHAIQTAHVMMQMEEVALNQHPNLVLVYGDVNSTIAAALVCAKLHIPVGHVEAGLRSFDRSMPEEINRLLTDQIADMLFTPSADGDENLLREGIAAQKIHRVGNVMIDTLIRLLPQAEARWRSERLVRWRDSRYALVTLHRPSNVDDPTMLRAILDTLVDISQQIPLIFPIHPRTRQRLADENIAGDQTRIHMIEPLGYLDFLALQQRAVLVITDSGGIQEETTYMGIPCLTVRENTERPITVTIGTNTLVGQDMQRLREETTRLLAGGFVARQVPPLWDGKAGKRIGEIISFK
jgi:UDP-N-acetylglucosamine 2-epimerase (non-hydrolysing)